MSGDITLHYSSLKRLPAVEAAGVDVSDLARGTLDRYRQIGIGPDGAIAGRADDSAVAPMIAPALIVALILATSILRACMGWRASMVRRGPLVVMTTIVRVPFSIVAPRSIVAFGFGVATMMAAMVGVVWCGRYGKRPVANRPGSKPVSAEYDLQSIPGRPEGLRQANVVVSPKKPRFLGLNLDFRNFGSPFGEDYA